MPPLRTAAERAKEKELHAAFQVFDTDASGALSLDELRAVFQRPGGGHALSDAQVDALFKEFDTNNDGALEFHEFSAFWKDTLGDAGDDMIKSATKTKKAGGGGGKKAKEKVFKLESMDELNLRVAQELTTGQTYEKQAASTDASTFERRLGAALIRNDKDNVLKAGKLDKYLTTTIKLWDKNGDGAISQSEFRLAVRNKPLSIKADNKEVDALFSSFDADGSGELELKELKPFFKALQNSAYAGEAEAMRLKEMAVACRARANWMREAGATMGQLERLKQDHDETAAGISLPVKMVAAIQARTGQQRIKQEEVPEKLFGCVAKSKTPGAPRAAFISGVLASLGVKPSTAEKALLDEINAWFDQSLIKQGLSPEHHPKAQLDLPPVLKVAYEEWEASTKSERERSKEIARITKLATEQQKEMATKIAAEEKARADAEAAVETLEANKSKADQEAETLKQAAGLASKPTGGDAKPPARRDADVAVRRTR